VTARNVACMRVAFSKHDAKRLGCSWEATIGKRRRVPGTIMGVGRGIPHDLAQYVIEASTGFAHGFWGCVAAGATFKSTGRKRTKPGRAVIVEHRADIVASEQLANLHLAQWYGGESTVVTRALDAALGQWYELREGQALVYEWPSTRGVVQ
jgi:hypothetical protein